MKKILTFLLCLIVFSAFNCYALTADQIARLATLDDDMNQWAAYNPVITLVGGTGNTVPQYVTHTGRYCKVGHLVAVDILFDGPTGNAGAGSGQINISLPITAGASNTTEDRTGGHLHNDANEYQALLQIALSAATLALTRQNSATQTAAMTGAEQNGTSTRTIRLAFCYEVD